MSTFLVGTALAGLVCLAIRAIVHAHKNGSCCGCSQCHHCSGACGKGSPRAAVKKAEN